MPPAKAVANQLGESLASKGYPAKSERPSSFTGDGLLGAFNFQLNLPNIGQRHLLIPWKPGSTPVIAAFPTTPKALPKGMTSFYQYRAHLDWEENPRDDEDLIAVGIQGNLDKQGTLTFDVTRGQSTPSGREMMAEMLQTLKQVHGPHGQGVKRIRCNWSDEPGSNTNYKLFRQTNDPFETKTGSWAREHGFTETTTHLDQKGHVVIDFTHPDASK